MKEKPKIELNKCSEIPVKIVFYLIIYTNIPVKLQIESVRTKVYIQKVGELEFTDKKQENWSLQIESKRTGVYRQKV